MPRQPKPVLSEFELGTLDQELYDQINGTRSPADLHLRETMANGHRCFPPDGYLSWQHRWFMGTGVRPAGW